MLTQKSYPQYEFSINVDSISRKMNILKNMGQKRI